MDSRIQNRILYLDYARSIVLFLVVFAHLYTHDSSVKLYVYAFHMPFFFLVSGILHKDEEFVPLLKKMAKRMLIPFCFFLFIGYLYCAIYSRSIALGTIYGSINGIVFGKSIEANDILWFLLALFCVRIMGNWVIRVPKVALPIIVVSSCIAIRYHLNYFYVGTSLMALPFYLFGYYARRGLSKVLTIKWHVLLAILLLAISVLISTYNKKVSLMAFSFGKAPFFPLRYTLFYINGLIGSVTILLLVGRMKKRISWLLKPSYCAISIVGLQYIPIMIWCRSIGLNQNYVISCAYSIMIILVCISFHMFVERKAVWLLGR